MGERPPDIDEDPEPPLPRSEATSADQEELTAVVVNEEEERERLEQATRVLIVESAAQAEIVDVKKRRCIVGVCILLALIVGNILTVLYVEKSRTNNDLISLTPSPTAPLIETSLDWSAFANNITLSPSVLSYPAREGSSSEERALEWLIEEGGAFPDKVATQRYAFVVLAFAMNVPDWNLEIGFSECDLKGVGCDSQQTVIMID